ncbi:MAG: hypothetical protein HUK22_08890, partial [Thermoguttaceae bacterium]|nr:hypothetical protein [Thermoguttaceae bacterium]
VDPAWEADVAFQLAPDAGSDVSADGDGFVASNDAGTGARYVGFHGAVYRGDDARERVLFHGTDGDDYLYYEAGSGYFIAGKITYRFENVNYISVDAGFGGNDVALIKDGPTDDALNASNDSFGLYGGGYAAIGRNFTDMKFCFINGGNDSYLAEDSGDSVALSFSGATSVATGVFSKFGEIAIANAANLDEDGEIIDVEPPTPGTNERAYRRVVLNCDSTTVAPRESVGELVLYGGGSGDFNISAGFGAVSALDVATGVSVSARAAKSLKILDVPETVGERLDVALEEGEEYSVIEGEETVSVVNSKGWSLVLPKWKKIVVPQPTPTPGTDATPSAVAPVPNALALGKTERDDVFRTLNSLNGDGGLFDDFDDEEFWIF